MMSERAKYILFFLAVAFVYGVTAQEVMYFWVDDKKLFFTEYNYPLLKFNDGHPWPPHRLFDIFYQSVWVNFYFKYIYGVLIEPLAGQQHFLDTFRQMSFVSYGLAMAGFYFLSTMYVRVFVKLSFKELAVFAALFYLFFIQYVGEFSQNHMTARVSVFITGLGFLYPLFAYALAGKNIFSEMNEYKSSALMLILCYVACFSYFHTMMFVSIGALALAIIYCFENYKRSDFSSMDRFFTKIKAEPKWVLTIMISFPTFMLTSILIAANSNRFASLYGDSNYEFSLERYKLDKALILLAVVFVIWAFNAYRNNTARIDKALTFRYGVIVLSLLLFVLSFELLSYQLKHFAFTGPDYTRLIITATALGYGFKIGKQGWAMIPMYFLFFIFTAGGIRAIVSQESDSRAYYHHNAMKVGVNLAYTFLCYGSNRTLLFYDRGYALHRSWWLPQRKRGYSRTGWYGIVVRHARLPPSSKKNPKIYFYYEPSIAKINKKLKELRETKPWQCARIKNDIYRVEKLDY